MFALLADTHPSIKEIYFKKKTERSTGYGRETIGRWIRVCRR